MTRSPELTKRPRRNGVGWRRSVLRSPIFPISMAIFAGFAFVVATDGGTTTRAAVPLAPVLDQFAARFGLGIKQIELNGYVQTDPARALDLIANQGEQSVLGLGVAETQAALLKMPWVARAEIKRVWPDRLIISLVERQPVAVWYGNGKEGSPEAFLIDRAGRVLSRLHQERGAVDAAELVQLTGIGARPRLSDVFALTDAVPELRELRLTYVRVGDRRWTLRFATGAEILLPVKNAASTLSRFAKVAALGDLASTDIFDLRVPGRYIHRTRQVRWSGLARGSRATSGGTN